jgi:hypothetical protein
MQTKEQRFEALVRLGCIVCHIAGLGRTDPCIHHLLGIKYRATGKKAHWRHTIPLCPTHHDGKSRIHPSAHGNPLLFKQMYGTQEDLLNATNDLLKRNLI